MLWVMNIESEIHQFRTLRNLNQFQGQLTYAFSSARFGNMSFLYGGDEVFANRRFFLQAVGIDLHNLVAMMPVHQTNIEVVGVKDRDKGSLDVKSAVPATDALITTEPNVALILNAADCSPVIITNDRADFVSLVHVGRDGANLGICQKVISRLQEMKFDPVNFIVGIGPTIECYQQSYLLTENPDEWLPYVFMSDEESKRIVVDNLGSNPPKYKIHSSNSRFINVDLVGYTIARLQESEVLINQIEASHSCTVCNAREGRLFSHTVSSQNLQIYPEARFMTVVQIN